MLPLNGLSMSIWWPNVINITQLVGLTVLSTQHLCFLENYLFVSEELPFLFYWTCMVTEILSWKYNIEPSSYHLSPFHYDWELGIVGSNGELSWNFWMWEWEWEFMLSLPGWKWNRYNFKDSDVRFSSTWTRDVGYANTMWERRLGTVAKEQNRKGDPTFEFHTLIPVVLKTWMCSFPGFRWDILISFNKYSVWLGYIEMVSITFNQKNSS